MGPCAAPERQSEMVRCRAVTEDVSHLPSSTRDTSGRHQGTGELCSLSLKTDPTDKVQQNQLHVAKSYIGKGRPKTQERCRGLSFGSGSSAELQKPEGLSRSMGTPLHSKDLSQMQSVG